MTNNLKKHLEKNSTLIIIKKGTRHLFYSDGKVDENRRKWDYV